MSWHAPAPSLALASILQHVYIRIPTSSVHETNYFQTTINPPISLPSNTIPENQNFGTPFNLLPTLKLQHLTLFSSPRSSTAGAIATKSSPFLRIRNVFTAFPLPLPLST